MCNSIFIGNQKFDFDIYGVINASFGFIHKLNNSIRVVNISNRDVPVRCPCGNCRITTKKVGPLEKINGIPARVYGDVIRFKTAGWKEIRVITCNETPNKLPIIRLNLKLYKKHFNLRKYILPFTYIKYKTNITTISKSNKYFEFILHEDTKIPIAANCCHFDIEEIDDKAIYIMLLILSAQLGGKKIWYHFEKAENRTYVSFTR